MTDTDRHDGVSGGLHHHMLPADDPHRALEILRQAAGLPALEESDDEDETAQS
jgi:hypothetical protein